MSKILSLLFVFCVAFHLSATSEGINTPIREDKLLLVTGCPRSGTHYISHLLRACGLDILHEEMGNHGCASWPMAKDTDLTVWGPSANKYNFQHVFHQVRNPLLVMSSIFTNEKPKSWQYYYKCVPELDPKNSRFVQTAAFWYYWNLLAEKKAEFTYRVEDIDIVFEEICRRLGIPVNEEALRSVPRDAHHHRIPYRIVFTWANLRKELPPDLFSKIEEMAIRYGYSVED